jgi:hypothetical protein
MITHRAVRDIQRCRAKYGSAWEEYERRVPYLFVPVSFFSFNFFCFFSVGDVYALVMECSGMGREVL